MVSVELEMVKLEEISELGKEIKDLARRQKQKAICKFYVAADNSINFL
jgi:hypothetical protein